MLTHCLSDIITRTDRTFRYHSITAELHEEGSGSYLIRYDALVGRPPAPRLLPCVQVVGSDVAETGNLRERQTC